MGRLPFRDRAEAGDRLAATLGSEVSRPGAVVIALPRGGVPIGYQIAQTHRLPLDVMVVRKLGVPGNEELALGAIASGGFEVRNDLIAAELDLSDADVAAIVARESTRLRALEAAYRGTLGAVPLAGRTVIVVDDGLATGASLRVAARAVRAQQPARLILGVPVGASTSCRELRAEADAVVCAEIPEPFYAVGSWYEDFTPVSDDDVHRLLTAAASRR